MGSIKHLIAFSSPQGFVPRLNGSPGLSDPRSRQEVTCAEQRPPHILLTSLLNSYSTVFLSVFAQVWLKFYTNVIWTPSLIIFCHFSLLSPSFYIFTSTFSQLFVTNSHHLPLSNLFKRVFCFGICSSSYLLSPYLAQIGRLNFNSIRGDVEQNSAIPKY